jgi:hypothetical protein
MTKRARDARTREARDKAIEYLGEMKLSACPACHRDAVDVHSEAPIRYPADALYRVPLPLEYALPGDGVVECDSVVHIVVSEAHCMACLAHLTVYGGTAFDARDARERVGTFIAGFIAGRTY